MTRSEFWAQVFIKLVEHHNTAMCVQVADLAVQEWDKRFEVKLPVKRKES